MSTDKFKALVHLVIDECKNPARLGAVRLNKILWCADSMMYRQTGNSISGAKYVRRERGPVPHHVLVAIRELKEAGLISVREPAQQYEPREFVSLVSPNKELFSDVEEGLVRTLVESICGHFTATEISELTHDDVWKAALEGEEIPLQATLVSEAGDYGAPVMKWAQEAFDRKMRGIIQPILACPGNMERPDVRSPGGSNSRPRVVLLESGIKAVVEVTGFADIDAVPSGVGVWIWMAP